MSKINAITQSNFFNKHLSKVINDDAFAAKTIVVCSVAKDVFAYTVRYKTTMDNEKIPEKRRPFVAAMDLASGVVTAIAQIVVGFAIASPKLQSKLWNAIFKDAQFKNIGLAKKGFATILALVGSGVITERVLVPLIATPMAEKMKNKYFTKDEVTGKTHYPFYEYLHWSSKDLKYFESKAKTKEPDLIEPDTFDFYIRPQRPNELFADTHFFVPRMKEINR